MFLLSKFAVHRKSIKVASPAYFGENLYLYILSFYHLFGLMVIVVHKGITYLTYL